MASIKQLAITSYMLLTFSGCSLLQPKTEYINVCPAPPFIERPELDVLNLKEDDTPDIVIQAHRITIKKLQKWGLEEEVILDGYRKKDTK
jgi:hypothetical protein